MSNNDDLLSLEELSVFLAVCEAGGFRAAAKRLNISASSVSEKLAQAERRLGLPLLIRTTRSVMPTEAGKALASRVMPLMAEVRAAVQDASSEHREVRGTLRLNVTGAVMTDIMPDLLDRFLCAYPKVRVDIQVDDRLVDITAASCDAGIRYGENLAHDMIAIPIGPRTQGTAAAAAPDYLEHHGVPRHPDELGRHHGIRLRFSSGALVPWTFEKGEESITIDPSARAILDVDAVAAAIGLAIKGHGVILTFETWLRTYIDAGILQPVLPEWWQTFEGPWLYYSNRLAPAPLRAFIDLVRTGQ